MKSAQILRGLFEDAGRQIFLARLGLVIVGKVHVVDLVCSFLSQAFEDRRFRNFEFFCAWLLGADAALLAIATDWLRNDVRSARAVGPNHSAKARIRCESAAWMREDGDRCDPEDHGEDNATAVVELFGRLRQIIVIQYRSGQNFDQRKENKQCAD